LVETAGGVRSPLADDGDVRDFARSLAPDVVLLVADAGLGTLNGVRLTVGALLDAGAASLPKVSRLVVVLNRFDPADELHRRNRSWLRQHDQLSVVTTSDGDADLCRAVLG